MTKPMEKNHGVNEHDKSRPVCVSPSSIEIVIMELDKIIVPEHIMKINGGCDILMKLLLLFLNVYSMNEVDRVTTMKLSIQLNALTPAGRRFILL